MTETPLPNSQVTITTPAALETLARGGDVPDVPCLLVDLRADAGDPAFAPLLRGFPRPVLALAGPDAAGPLLEACDVRAEALEALAPVLANIEHAPIAAAVLVHVLRATEGMAPADALTVESLAYATLQAGPEFARWNAERETPAAPPAENGPPVIAARDGGTLRLTLNRPRNRNAISVEMRDALVEAFQLAEADETIAEVLVDGAGACFSVGGDLTEFGLAPSPAAAHMIRMQRLPARALLPSAGRAAFHVHGACIGAGVELPAFAARLGARAGAFFQLPEIRFGLIPGAGGCVSIPRRIGRQRMAYFALSARRINAKTALAWGLIDEITP